MMMMMMMMTHSDGFVGATHSIIRLYGGMTIHVNRACLRTRHPTLQRRRSDVAAIRPSGLVVVVVVMVMVMVMVMVSVEGWVGTRTRHRTRSSPPSIQTWVVPSTERAMTQPRDGNGLAYPPHTASTPLRRRRHPSGPDVKCFNR